MKPRTNKQKNRFEETIKRLRRKAKLDDDISPNLNFDFDLGLISGPDIDPNPDLDIDRVAESYNNGLVHCVPVNNIKN